MNDSPRHLPAAGVVRVIGTEAAGTGFVVSADGLIVTCAHVVGDVPVHGTVVVEPHVTGQPRDAVVAQRLDPPDVAVLRLRGSLPPEAAVLPLGSSPAGKRAGLQTFGFPRLRREAGFPGEITILAGRTADEAGYPQLALRSSEATVGFSGAPIWDPQLGAVVGLVKSIAGPEEREGVPVLADPGLRLGNAAIGVPVEIIREVCPALRLPEGCPYRGLESFAEDHVDYYFGRDDAIDQLLASLARHAFVAVVAVSGSGKSSLLQAGLAKGLKRNPVPGLAGRIRGYLRISTRPVDELLHELARLGVHLRGAEPSGDPDGLLTQASDLARQVLHAIPEDELLLVVDQFERLYTQCKEQERNRFIDLLLGIAGDAVKVVIGLRADFYHAVLDHKGLSESVVRGQVTLLPMTEEQLRSVIAAPAEKLLRSFQPGLVDQLVADVQGRAGDLPLLQFALTELWARDASTGVLTSHSYQALGNPDGDGDPAIGADGQPLPGVQGALVGRAEQVWKAFSQSERAVVQRILLGLVAAAAAASVEAGSLPGATSRQTRISEFSETDQVLVRRLVDARLLTSGRAAIGGQPTVEVAHEALLRAWPRLQGWVSQHRDFIRWRATDLAPYLNRWLDTGRDQDFLLPRQLLRAAREWLEQRPEDLAGPPAEYIAASEQWWAEQEEQQRERTRKDYIAQAARGAVGAALGFAGVLGYLFFRLPNVGSRAVLLVFLAALSLGGGVGFAIGMSLWYLRDRGIFTAAGAAVAGAATGGLAFPLFVQVATLAPFEFQQAITGMLLAAPLGASVGGVARLRHRLAATTLAGPAALTLAVTFGTLARSPEGWPGIILAGLWLGILTGLGFATAHIDKPEAAA